MSENIYRLDLTEWERWLLRRAVATLCSMAHEGTGTINQCDDMDAKLRALEPIGTGGTTEGNG